jgi:hypothetical protein
MSRNISLAITSDYADCCHSYACACKVFACLCHECTLLLALVTDSVSVYSALLLTCLCRIAQELTIKYSFAKVSSTLTAQLSYTEAVQNVADYHHTANCHL